MCIGCAVINATSLRKFIFLPCLWSLTPLRGGKSPFQDRLNMLASRLKLKVREINLFLLFLVICCGLQFELWSLSQETKARRKKYLMTLNIVLFLEFLHRSYCFPL